MGNRIRDVTIEALDGAPLAATLTEPDEGAPLLGTVMIAAATGVPRRFYQGFAEHLAQAGLACATFDYRGIGGSLRGPLRASAARMSDWGELDLPGVAAYLSAHAPSVPLLQVGHSVGGQLLGLMPDNHRVRALLTVGAQSGFWRNWDGRGRAQMALYWYLLFPLLTNALGYLPLRRLTGTGLDIPGGVSRQWAKWARDPEHVFGHARASGIETRFTGWSGALRAYAISDDNFAPRRSVDALLGFYRSARKELRLVSPEQVGALQIGHTAFFTRRFKDPLWDEARSWLLAQAAR